jgi:hypothetical protein
VPNSNPAASTETAVVFNLIAIGALDWFVDAKLMIMAKKQGGSKGSM